VQPASAAVTAIVAVSTTPILVMRDFIIATPLVWG
jgi:hypothetical protein